MYSEKRDWIRVAVIFAAIFGCQLLRDWLMDYMGWSGWGRRIAVSIVVMLIAGISAAIILRRHKVQL